MRFLSRLLTLVSIHLTKSMSSFAMELLSSFDNLKINFFKLSVAAYLITNMFLFSFLFCLFELAFQYDQSGDIKLTATLALSIGLSLFSLLTIIGFYFYSFKKENKFKFKFNKNKPPETPHITLENAISQLIMEMAKDREFKRRESQVHSRNSKFSQTETVFQQAAPKSATTNPFTQRATDSKQKTTDAKAAGGFEPYFQDAEVSWAE